MTWWTRIGVGCQKMKLRELKMETVQVEEMSSDDMELLADLIARWILTGLEKPEQKQGHLSNPKGHRIKKLP